MKAAYIDYKSDVLFVMQLREEGVDLVVSDSLKEFDERSSLEDFSVLLFHPGVEHQYEIGEVKRKYPNLALAIVTAPTSQGDYMARKRDLLIFSYRNINEIIKFIQTNQ